MDHIEGLMKMKEELLTKHILHILHSYCILTHTSIDFSLVNMKSSVAWLFSLASLFVERTRLDERIYKYKIQIPHS